MRASRVLEEVPGLTYRQLDLWTRGGYLHTERDGTGAGRARHYSAEEVRVAALMYRLHTAGLNVGAAHLAARAVAAGRPAVLAPGIEVLVTDP